jgi:hypothetical protein
MDKDQLIQMKADIEKQRDELSIEANKQIAFYNGQISMLEQLIKEEQASAPIEEKEKE